MAKLKFDYDNFAYNLPDAFQKDPDSDNYKLLAVEKYICDAIMQIMSDIYDITDIDKATGAALDMHGARHQILRGSSDDTQYRIRIKGKIAQSLCDGSRDSVAEAVAFILSSDTSQIQLRTKEQGKVELLGIPVELLIDAGFTTEQINDMLNALFPTGVVLEDVQYIGTFEYGSIDTASEYAPDNGYGNVEQTIGGFYGLIGTMRGKIGG